MIVVGGNRDDHMSRLQQALNSRDLDLPLFWDENHRLAKLLELRWTPIVTVIGRDWQVVYRGRIDDSWRDESKVKERYLDRAVDAALEGKRVSDHLADPFMGSRMR